MRSVLVDLSQTNLSNRFRQISLRGCSSGSFEISPAFTGAPAPDTDSYGSSQQKSKPPRHPFRVGVWVCNIRTKKVAIIEQRVPPRGGPNGPEDIFLMEAAAGAELGWNQFDIRLATPEEIEAEQVNRKAKKEESERERAEWSAKWEARRATKRRIRGSCNLFAVAQRQRRKSELLVGRAWDEGDYVVFEAVDGTIRSRQTYRSKGAATRAYNTAIATGYTELDADEERFDRLCPALVQARLLSDNTTSRRNVKGSAHRCSSPDTDLRPHPAATDAYRYSPRG